MTIILNNFKYLCVSFGIVVIALGLSELRIPLTNQVATVAQPMAHINSKKRSIDRSGVARFGKASFYAETFFGRTMADGTPMRPQGNNAASRTLPLGTTAMVVNLQSGRSAIVKIRDRGPYVDGRIVDLSPATAQKIGLGRNQGITDVAVVPISLPHIRLTRLPSKTDTQS